MLTDKDETGEAMDETKAVPEFEPFDKIARLARSCVITEKIDGTNAQICITEDGGFFTGSRSGWITPERDNFGFSRWAYEHKDDLLKLGPGRHYGEWWGSGIQRRYGLTEKRFSLFNVGRWAPHLLPNTHEAACVCPTCADRRLAGVKPDCAHVVPVLYTGLFSDAAVAEALETLKREGSRASPGFMKPEGVIVYHAASRTLFKRTVEKDEKPKGSKEAA